MKAIIENIRLEWGCGGIRPALPLVSDEEIREATYGFFRSVQEKTLGVWNKIKRTKRMKDSITLDVVLNVLVIVAVIFFLAMVFLGVYFECVATT